MAWISSVLVAALAASVAVDTAIGASGTAAPAATSAGVPGGWSSAAVTTATTDLLVKAMTANGEKGYSSSAGSTRVCYTQVQSLETQVVAGTNYRFHVSGCSVSSAKKAGKCSSAAKKSCSPKRYAITVFEQTWTSTLQVTSIKAEGSSLHVTIKGADEYPSKFDYPDYLRIYFDKTKKKGEGKNPQRESSAYKLQVTGGRRRLHALTHSFLRRRPSTLMMKKMMRRSLLSLAALATLLHPTGAQLGAWQAREVTSRDSQLLADALALEGAAYEARTRVCFMDVVSLETQTVAGTNMRFVVAGVDVTELGADAGGECADDADGPIGGFVVSVSQGLDQALRVTDVRTKDLMHVESFAAEYDRDDKEPGYGNDDEAEEALEDMDVPEDEPPQEPKLPKADELDIDDADDREIAAAIEVSEDEKTLIDEWLEGNKDKVNEYGDPAGTFYTGGTPLFDERTGTTIDKYEYIVRRHPDRPWAAEEAEQGTLRVNMLMSGERDGATVSQSSVGSFLTFIALLGLFGAAIVAIAIAKRQRGARRFSYSQINGRGPL